MLQIYFYVPESHLEIVKNAMFEAGAGKIGNYGHCSWQVLGQGQFKPLEGSEYFIGEMGKVGKIPEYKVEMVCDHDHIGAVIDALKKAHPYEEPAYQVIRLGMA
ncbi:MAG: NGG1p interacting factor NIF3 [Gammaproteobacteria bacterium]|nr:NGG1p interacting factor NIF3 [Gammaproteobacteria bacterium]